MIIKFQDDPLFVEYSIFTLLTALDVHAIFCEVPGTQDSPPFGVMTVTLGGAIVVKMELLTSFTAAFDASPIRISACVVGGCGTVQE